MGRNGTGSAHFARLLRQRIHSPLVSKKYAAGDTISSISIFVGLHHDYRVTISAELDALSGILWRTFATLREWLPTECRESWQSLEGLGCRPNSASKL